MSSRVDIWSVYLDQEIKYAKDEQIVRNLFERTLSLALKPKKMKFFFKKYLQYESTVTKDETRINYVKERAREYVNNVMSQYDNGGQQQNEDDS